MRISRLILVAILFTFSLPVASSAKTSTTFHTLYVAAQEEKRPIDFSVDFRGTYEAYKFLVKIDGTQDSTENAKPLTSDMTVNVSVITPDQGFVLATIDVRLVEENLYVRLRDVTLKNTEKSGISEEDYLPYLNVWVRFPLDQKTFDQVSKSGKAERSKIAKSISRFFTVTDTKNGNGFRYTLTIPKNKQKALRTTLMTKARRYSSPTLNTEMRRHIRTTTLSLGFVYDILSDGSFDGSSMNMEFKSIFSGKPLSYTFNATVKTLLYVAPIIAPAESVTQDELLGASLSSMGIADARNAQRRADVHTILNATYQYAIDNNGNFPSEITTTETEICRSGVNVNCSGLVNLDVLTDMYLVSVPYDPQTATATSTRYTIFTNGDRVTVRALDSEGGVTISATR